MNESMNIWFGDERHEHGRSTAVKTRRPSGLTVSELARRAGVAPDVVRYYARIGLLAPARNPDNGYRLFHTQDAERLCFIRLAQQTGCTLQDIRTILDGVESGGFDDEALRTILEQRLAVTRSRSRDLQRQERALQQALQNCRDIPATGSGLERLARWLRGLLS